MANWSRNNNNNHSSFWLDDDIFSNNIDILTGEKVSNGKDYVKMASTLKAIGNFVKIVSGNDVKVKYNNRDESYTDGKTVTISSKVNGKSFDSTVGLALHEGSHVKLSDFRLLKELLGYNGADYLAKAFDFTITEDMNSKGLYLQTLKDLINIIEDRRIDYHIFTTAPGYQGYYTALYDRYFHAKVIDKALVSSEHREENVESYLFRICNLTNSNRDLSSLKGLTEIYKIINLANISRLENTAQAVKTAIEVFKVLDKHIPLPPKEEGEDTTSGKSDNKDDENEESNSNCQSGSCNHPELSANDRSKLRKAIEKQKDFIRNKIKKSSIRKSEESKINAINNSDADYKLVGNGIQKNWHSTSSGTDCLIVQKVTKEIAQSNAFDTFTTDQYRFDSNQEAIDKGFTLGTMLGRKLQVRNDSRDLKYNRLNKGKIDKRMIASAGFGNENIFQQVFQDVHKEANIHLSVDASGSMSGQKWYSSLTAVVAIAKAASMVGNLNVQISFRSTETQGNKYIPAIFIGYDSRKDNIRKIQNLFRFFTTPGTTPEGLCFEAIQNIITSSTGDLDSYFINFSDGEPYFESKVISYWGQQATDHTKKQVTSMKEKGIKVLSYFISSSEQELSDNFIKMYGNDSKNVSVDELIPLAKTLNKMFTEK